MDALSACISQVMYQVPDPNKDCKAPLVKLSRDLSAACQSEISEDFALQLPVFESPATAVTKP